MREQRTKQIKGSSVKPGHTITGIVDRWGNVAPMNVGTVMERQGTLITTDSVSQPWMIDNKSTYEVVS